MGVPASPAGFRSQTYSLRSYSTSIPNACYAKVKKILWMIFAGSYHYALANVFVTPLLKYPRTRMHTNPHTKIVNNFVDK